MKNSKKVCILKRRFSSAGGLEKYTLRLAQAFAGRDYEVHILTADPIPKTHVSEKISFHRLYAESFFSFRSIELFDQACSRFLQKNPFPIVFGMDRNRRQNFYRAGNGVHAAYLQIRSKYDPLVKKLTYPINPLHRLILSIEKEAFESKDLRTLFTNSNYVKNQLLEHYSIEPNKIRVVHNGVEWKEMQHSFDGWIEQKTKKAADLRLDPTDFHFLFVGNGFKRKGLDLLLKALVNVPFRDFHLSVVGKDSNPGEFFKLVKDLKLDKKVTFFGPQKDLKKFYQLADCLVIPSYYDPFANVTVEALAMGLFVVTSNSNGGAEVITPESGAIIPELFNRESFTDALTHALKFPKTWIRSQNIRNSVEYLDFPNQLSKLVDPCLNL